MTAAGGISETVQCQTLSSSHWLWGVLQDFISNPLAFIEETANQGQGLMKFRLFRVTGYLVTDPELIATVLLTEHRRFTKNRRVHRRLERVFGAGLLTAEGDEWKSLRRRSSPAFRPASIQGYMELIERSVASTLDDWSPGQPVELHQAMMNLTSNVVSEVLFGISIREESEAVRNSMEELVSAIDERLKTSVALPEYIPTARNKRYLKAIEDMDELVYSFISKATGVRAQTSLLRDLIRLAREERVFSEKSLRDQIVTLFLAGHETTANTLTFALYLLNQHQDVMQSVRKDADADSAETSQALLTAVIKEAMRLYPPAYIIGRQAAEPVQIGNERLPKGAVVYIAPWVTHRSAVFDQAEAFRPERWLDGSCEDLPRFTYMPFGGGPRVCIGEGLAMAEAVMALRAILRRVDLQFESKKEIELKASITLRPAERLVVRPQLRKTTVTDHYEF